MLVLADAALMQLDAGCTALKAVFNSKLIGKGKCLAELLQPHSTGTYTLLYICSHKKNESRFFLRKCPRFNCAL